MLSFAIPNSAGIKRLTIGITGCDGKRAELTFVAASPNAPLVYQPTPEDLQEMSAHFTNAETPRGDELYDGE